ncbi:MAG: cytoplasmic protein [Deltaproteobacteria bacterium]|nr:cytoplasmic protein [Deltaproteobacteria bacterium]MBW1951990.1 cytoplasmic protein [Deltaproteobacteria bacterium]MBW1987225.1 cytoplasmic protein [Deltaproteobacteria bacterium]MBW2134294.1 cytoplasmic protein [Deltaproteobacteria bacterium]
MSADYRPEPSFQQLEASALYCPQCQQAVPVRKRLLLILPDGELHEYLCVFCAASLGTKIERQTEPVPGLI